MTGNDISALFLVTAVSFFGTKASKPKWMGIGSIITGKAHTQLTHDVITTLLRRHFNVLTLLERPYIGVIRRHVLVGYFHIQTISTISTSEITWKIMVKSLDCPNCKIVFKILYIEYSKNLVIIANLAKSRTFFLFTLTKVL